MKDRVQRQDDHGGRPDVQRLHLLWKVQRLQLLRKVQLLAEYERVDSSDFEPMRS